MRISTSSQQPEPSASEFGAMAPNLALQGTRDEAARP